MRWELQEIKQHIYEDGSISTSDIQLLNDVFAAGFGEEEAELLLDLNHVLSGNDLAPEFVTLFVDSLSAYAVESGTLSAAKWEWIKGHILRDEVVDEVEARLLARIATMAKTLPAEFPGQ
ncbi:MAG: hypothetical protein HY985_19010 [Magnetospirillum sp.]|nr:hypothetical protein [Magnetospirillum sp.]